MSVLVFMEAAGGADTAQLQLDLSSSTEEKVLLLTYLFTYFVAHFSLFFVNTSQLCKD